MAEFSDETCTALKFYVYRLGDPRDGRTFYVGKGQGNRVFAHIKLALKGEDGLRYDHIRDIQSKGLEPHVIIHRHGLDERVAFDIEAALIDAYGLSDLTNDVRGQDTERGMMTAGEIVESYGAQPAEIKVPAILIKIEREWRHELTPEQLYERTRRYWKCNPERKKKPPQYAFSVARGLIREVFDINAWETYLDMSLEVIDPSRLQQSRSEADRKGQSRRGFIGCPTKDGALRAALLGRSVRHIPFGSGNPIAYVNCE
jgi:uncharacterized protein